MESLTERAPRAPRLDAVVLAAARTACDDRFDPRLPARGDDRPDRGHHRHAATRAAAGARKLRTGCAAFDPAHLAWNGRRLHAAHADRDDRPRRRRRPGTCVRSLQHVAAGRRLGRARDPLDRGYDPYQRFPRHRDSSARARLPLRVRGCGRAACDRPRRLAPRLRERDVARIMAAATAPAPA